MRGFLVMAMFAVSFVQADIDTVSVDRDDGHGSTRIEGTTGDVYVDDGSGSNAVQDTESDLIIEKEGGERLTYSGIRGNVERDT